MLLALILPALASSYTETYGAVTSGPAGFSLQDDFRANQFVVDATVQITGVSLYAARDWDSPCNPCTVTTYLRTEPTSGSVWTATQLGTASMAYTDGGFGYLNMTMTSTPTLTSGREYLIGFYTPGNVRVQVGTIADPAWATTTWAYFLNYATGLSTRDWTSPGYAMGAQIHHTLTFTAADTDRDGFDTLSDCDDAVASTYPGATDRWYDGVDANCDGADDYDLDADGELDASGGGADCDDTDADVYPGAVDVWYDGVDSDCGGEDDYDQDDDGERATSGGGRDCDDTDDAVRPGAVDAFYDGVDTDCAGNDDYDMDRDGHRPLVWGGDDCDDTRANVYPGAADVPYDGVDQDCSGSDEADADHDGHRAASAGGDDCDDTDPAVWQDCDTGGGADSGTDDSGTDTGSGNDSGTTDTGTDTGDGNDTSVSDTGSGTATDDTDSEPDGPSPKRTDDAAGGCSTSGGGHPRGLSLTLMLGFGALAARVRRRAS